MIAVPFTCAPIMEHKIEKDIGGECVVRVIINNEVRHLETEIFVNYILTYLLNYCAQTGTGSHNCVISYPTSLRLIRLVP